MKSAGMKWLNQWWVCLTLVFLILDSCSAQRAWCLLPEGAYLGIGGSRYDLDSDHPSVESYKGTGYQLIFGKFNGSRMAGEIILSGGHSFPVKPVPDPYYPEDTAEYGYFLLGARYYFLNPGKHSISPWLGLGWAWHAITWNTYFYEIDGTSLTPYVGLDIAVGGKRGIFRVELKRHFFSASSGLYGGSYDVDVKETNLSLVFIFGK